MKFSIEKCTKFLLLTTILTFVNLSVYGQTNFQKGFYITADYDTIQGLINDKGEVGNSSSCTFKKDQKSERLKFSAEEIPGYGFADGRYYISRKIKIEDEQFTVFVEFLVDGISNLYFYRDHNYYFYIIENKNGETLEIYKKEVKQFVGGRESIHDTYQHIRMLKLAFSDCMEIQPQVEEAELSHKALIKLTKDYHNYVCDDQECIVYEKNLGPPRFYVAPIIGGTSSSLSFNREFYSRFSFEQNQNLTYGLQFNLMFPRINERINFQLDFLYGNNDFVGYYNDYYELHVLNDMLQTSFLVKYIFPRSKIRPNFGLGFAANFLLDMQPKAYVENIPGSPPQEPELNDIYMATDLMGAVAQIGLNYRVFGNIEMFSNFRYTYSGGKAQGTDGYVTTTINSLNFSVGFYLPKVK